MHLLGQFGEFGATLLAPLVELFQDTGHLRHADLGQPIGEAHAASVDGAAAGARRGRSHDAVDPLHERAKRG